MEIVTSWELKGIEKGRVEGRVEGRMQGRMQGRIEERQEMLLDLLAAKFGPVSSTVSERVRSIGSLDDLRALTNRSLAAGSLRELGFDSGIQ